MKIKVGDRVVVSERVSSDYQAFLEVLDEVIMDGRIPPDGIIPDAPPGTVGTVRETKHWPLLGVQLDGHPQLSGYNLDELVKLPVEPPELLEQKHRILQTMLTPTRGRYRTEEGYYWEVEHGTVELYSPGGQRIKRWKHEPQVGEVFKWIRKDKRRS